MDTESGGVNGWCYLQKGAWNPGFGFGFDCFAIYSVIDDPQDKNDSPILFSSIDVDKDTVNHDEEE